MPQTPAEPALGVQSEANEQPLNIVVGKSSQTWQQLLRDFILRIFGQLLSIREYFLSLFLHLVQSTFCLCLQRLLPPTKATKAQSAPNSQCRQHLQFKTRTSSIVGTCNLV